MTTPFSAEWARIIDKMISDRVGFSNATGTLITRDVSSFLAYVQLDGSSTPVPVKMPGSVAGRPGDRVVLNKLYMGNSPYWVVTAAYTLPSVMQASWGFIRAPASETTVVTGVTTSAFDFYTSPNISINPGYTYMLLVTVPVVSYSGNNQEWAFSVRDQNTNYLASSGNCAILTSGSYQNGMAMGPVVPRSDQTVLTLTMAVQKITSVGSIDVRCSALHPWSALLIQTGLGGSLLST